MASLKGKEAKIGGIRILDENGASNITKGFKMHPRVERAKSGEKSRKNAGNVATAVTRKSVPLGSSAVATAQTDVNHGKGKMQLTENVVGKCKGSVNLRAGRKALVDVSNLNNNRSNQMRSQLTNNPKIMKDKLVVVANKSQGKTATGSNPCRTRISLTRTVVVANASSKHTKQSAKRSLPAIHRPTVHDEASMTKKVLPGSISYQGHPKTQFLGHSKFIKNQGLKLSRPRLSLAAQKTLDGNASLRKPIQSRSTSIVTSSKLTRAPMVVRKANIVKSLTTKPCEVTGAAEPNNCSCDNEPVTSQGCDQVKIESEGNSCSEGKVTAIISRSKRNRRKSYTSSLVARSEILGEFTESTDFIKKDDLTIIDDSTNPLEVVEYVDDIYQYYWTMEVQNSLPADFMVLQADITPRMRGILINWLIEVHLKFQLMQETLFLMVDLLDRVLSVIPVLKNELQMVGLTALLLASKYEDYWHPKINELISISANVYTRDQILSMEKLVLRKLRFRLNMPTPYVFMLRFLKASQSDKKLEDLAFYLIELCLMEFEASKYRPSLLCASAIYVARCTLQIVPAWTLRLRKYARYEESQLRPCAEMILRLHKAASLKPTKTTYEKFLSSERSNVAALTAIDMLPSCSAAKG